MIALVVGALVAAAGASAPGDGMREPDGIELAQLSFRSRMVIRVETAPAPPLQTMFREKKGPRCMRMSDVLGAAVISPSGVDFVLRGGDRVRAQFGDSCPGLDYYSGFYVRPPADGRICADRDVVRDRAGGECAIERFRKLERRK